MLQGMHMRFIRWHTAAAIWGARDPESDIIYLYGEYHRRRSSREERLAPSQLCYQVAYCCRNLGCTRSRVRYHLFVWRVSSKTKLERRKACAKSIVLRRVIPALTHL